MHPESRWPTWLLTVWTGGLALGADMAVPAYMMTRHVAVPATLPWWDVFVAVPFWWLARRLGLRRRRLSVLLLAGLWVLVLQDAGFITDVVVGVPEVAAGVVVYAATALALLTAAGAAALAAAAASRASARRRATSA